MAYSSSLEFLMLHCLKHLFYLSADQPISSGHGAFFSTM